MCPIGITVSGFRLSGSTGANSTTSCDCAPERENPGLLVSDGAVWPLMDNELTARELLMAFMTASEGRLSDPERDIGGRGVSVTVDSVPANSLYDGFLLGGAGITMTGPGGTFAF